MSSDKKYFSIAEVSGITDLTAHKLRYLEKSAGVLHVLKIRGRRYYTEDDIRLIKQLAFSASSRERENHVACPSNMLCKIDELMTKLLTLSESGS